MNILKRIYLFARELRTSENGSIIIMTAFMLLTLIISAGVAVDMARMQTLRAKLLSSLDAAGLAAGAAPSGSDISAIAQKYFDANFTAGYLDSSNVTVVTTCADSSGALVNCTSSNVATINLSAKTMQNMALMPVVGIKKMPIGAQSQITRSTTSGIELALVIDNTGSMSQPVDSSNSNVSKIIALKCALAGDAALGGGSTCSSNNLTTTGLLDVIYGSSNTLPDVFVGVVPFSNMVNLSTISKAPGTSFINNAAQSNLENCISSRDGNTASSIDGAPITLDISDDPPTSAVTFFKALQKDNSSDIQCPVAATLPMTVNKSDVVGAIQTMSPVGNTMLNIGLAWGWRMLSPNWKGLWGATPTYGGSNGSQPLPLPYNTPGMTKVVVFMTDGINNTDSGSASYNDSSTEATTAYEFQTSRYSAPNNSSTIPSDTKLDTLTQQVCDAMKAQGILIYTIGFGVDKKAPLTISDIRGYTGNYVETQLLQSCSSTPTLACNSPGSDCFIAPTNAQLANAFQAVGTTINNLRISH